MRHQHAALPTVAGGTTMQIGTFRLMSDKATTTTSYLTAGATTAGGLLSLSEWALLIGIIATVATFALNYWVQIQSLKMAEREHKAKMKKLGEE